MKKKKKNKKEIEGGNTIPPFSNCANGFFEASVNTQWGKGSILFYLYLQKLLALLSLKDIVDRSNDSIHSWIFKTVWFFKYWRVKLAFSLNKNVKLSSHSKCFPSLNSTDFGFEDLPAERRYTVYSFTLLSLCFLFPQLVLVRTPGASPNKLLECLCKAWKKWCLQQMKWRCCKFLSRRIGERLRKVGMLELTVQGQRITGRLCFSRDPEDTLSTKARKNASWGRHQHLVKLSVVCHL